MPTRTEQYIYWKDRGNLSNKEVAYICEVTTQTVSRWNTRYRLEKGIIAKSKQACVPKVENIAKLKDFVIKNRKEAKSVRSEAKKDQARWLAEDLSNSFTKILKVRQHVKDQHFDAAQEVLHHVYQDVYKYILEIENLRNTRL